MKEHYCNLLFHICRNVGLILCYALPGLVIHAQDKSLDFYANIATGGFSGTESVLVDTIHYTDLPADKQLPWSNSLRYSFNPLKKIMTKNDMLLELTKLRNQYAPYLQNLAPPLQEKRKSIRIDSMQMRYETIEDQQDFSRLLRGSGKWQTVAIPCYHGPQGYSTAWYRKEITLSGDMFELPALMLHFNGADYYTDAFLNGHHIGFHEGMLDEFEFSMMKYARPGKNVLLIKMGNDYPMMGAEWPRRYGNKLSAANSPGWNSAIDGWHECPAGYGIYQNLYIETRSLPYISDIYCRPLVKESAVETWIELDRNDGHLDNDYIIRYKLYGQNFKETVFDNKVDTILKVVSGNVLHKTFLKIPVESLRLWSPETPWLYQMQIELYDLKSGILLDSRKQQFGMRTFVISRESTPKGRMYLNGNEIRLRGANTMGFLQLDVMNRDWEQLTEDLLLAKLTNMNFIRTTQRIMPKEVYEYADCLGIMMQSDLPLFAYINQKQFPQILQQASRIERVLRNHPSVIMLSYLNEPGSGYRSNSISKYAYKQLFEALNVVVHNENPDRAVKYVDGDVQSLSRLYSDIHCYNIWYDSDNSYLADMCRGAFMPVNRGWMYGSGEFGAEGLNSVGLMERLYPKNFLKTEGDGSWSPQYITGCQTAGTYMHWFEKQTTMGGWVEESQKHQAWGVQKITRAYRRMSRMNSFAVHLFIDAWPNGWAKAIMDCERTPKKAWFVYRDALTPLAVQIETERNAFFGGERYPFQVWLCNDTQKQPDAVLKYTLEEKEKIINSGSIIASVPTIEEGTRFQGFLPVTMPKVKKKTKIIIRVGLFNKVTNEAIHEENCVVWVSPAIEDNTSRRIYLVGNNTDAESIIKTFQLKNIVSEGKIENDDFIIVCDPVITDAVQAEIEKAVKQGATALLLKDALSEKHPLFHLNLTVDTMDKSYWIIFRNTNHLWLKGSCSTDLKYNYSSVKSIPYKHITRAFHADDLTPVLMNGDGMVAGEKKDGYGRWIVCSLKLNGMIETTPTLTYMVKHMINK